MDDLNKKGAGDRSKINMHEDYEVKYWTRQLGVSRDELEKRSTRLETRPQPFARNPLVLVSPVPSKYARRVVPTALVALPGPILNQWPVLLP
jgi:hypothetical protein